jgi:molybdopterin-guanine dinucleotide biosynthesis protein A
VTTIDHPPTLGVLLAGGLARRMGGGDKGLKRVGGETIIARVIERLRPQCAGLILNANGDPARLAFLGLPIVPDDVPGFAGPLAGVLAALDWAARERPDIGWVVSAPTDGPFLPRDLVARLHEARAAADVPLACARSARQPHPPIGLWPVALRSDLRHALVVEHERKIDRWTARHGIAHADWAVDPVDPFFNANSPEDLAEAEAMIHRFGASA